MQDNLAGQLITDRYRIVRRIGEGGMGAVYEAEHTDIGRRVAVKILHAAYSRDKQLVERFRQEARAATKVGHPNIVEVTDSGTTEDGRLFFVMELLSGVDLAQIMAKTRRLPLKRSLAIALQICRGLHAAHEAGIVHRDLKPENVFLIERNGQQDMVKVLDFGVAINVELVRAGSARLTTPGMAMGTPEYMAPEQAAGEAVDRRIDIYATATMLYEMLTGHLPHEGSSLMQLLHKKATEPPMPPTHHRQDLPPELEPALLRGLEADPANRYQTMAELGDALEETLRELTSNYPVFSPGEESPGLGVEPTLPAGPLARHRAASNPPLGTPPAWNRPAMGGTPLGTTGPMAPGNVTHSTLSMQRPPSASRGRALAVLITLILSTAAGGAGVWWWWNRPAPQSAAAGVAAALDGGATPDALALARAAAKQLHNTKKNPPKKPPRKKLTPAEVERLLEWVRRAAAGHRFLRPKGDNVRDLLARIEQDHPNHPKARAHRQRICKALIRRGRINARRHRPGAADRYFRTCLALDAENKRARVALALLRLRQGRRALHRRRYRRAHKQALRLLKVMPDSASGRELLGDISMRRRQYRTAVAHYQDALEGKLSRRHRRVVRIKLRRAKRRAK